MSVNAPSALVSYLLSPRAIREQSAALTEHVASGRSEHWTLDRSRLRHAVNVTLAVTKETYPQGTVPYHSRWRHFDAGGAARVAHLDSLLAGMNRDDAAMARFELAIVSVLLDAGAGAAWCYRDSQFGGEHRRSEGLAVASFAMFTSGLFSSDPQQPLRVDARGLRNLDQEALAAALQVTDDNPLVGLEGRHELLQSLASALEARPSVFGKGGHARLGGLYRSLCDVLEHNRLRARHILEAVLNHLGSIWPGRTVIDRVNLGDCWAHPALDPHGPGGGYVPFHKLSQWLSYSLIEPLEKAGIAVDGLDELTGLPEYRNGGLFYDLGIIALKDPTAVSRNHLPGDPLIVEWRALTVTLLDELAHNMREQLCKTPLELPLTKILQGGTWTAGRRTAVELRPGGLPPLQIVSDGTVF